MDRADALRALIERVDAGDTWDRIDVGVTVDALGAAGGASNFVAALSGSLDAVARLEAPLRERGWFDNHTVNQVNGETEWLWEWARLDHDDTVACAEAEATSEARARLIAALKAMLHEEEAR